MKLSCQKYPQLQVNTPAGVAKFVDGLFMSDDTKLCKHVLALGYVQELACETEADKEPDDAGKPVD